jgi:hypothetical protein
MGFVASAVLFLLPCWLLLVVWTKVYDRHERPSPCNWRGFCLKLSVIVATLATYATLAFLFSWFYSGDSPHGMWPSPGLWRYLGPISGWSGLLSIILAIAGKGRGRWQVTGSALAVILAKVMIFMLERD